MTEHQFIALVVILIIAEVIRYMLDKTNNQLGVTEILTKIGLHNERAFNTYLEHLKRSQGDHSNLMAMACISSGKCRRTPEEYTKELLDRIIEKESERQGEECTEDDCNDCEPKDCVCEEDDEQEDTEPCASKIIDDEQAVTEENQKAVKNQNHDSTMRALKESIGEQTLRDRKVK